MIRQAQKRSDHRKRIVANILAVLAALTFVAFLERADLLSPLNSSAERSLTGPLKARVAASIANAGEWIGNENIKAEGRVITYTTPSGSTKKVVVASIYAARQTPSLTLILLIGAVVAWRWWGLGLIRGLILVASAPLATIGLMPMLAGACLAVSRRLADFDAPDDANFAEAVAFHMPVFLTAGITVALWWVVKNMVSDDSQTEISTEAARRRPMIGPSKCALIAFAAGILAALFFSIAGVLTKVGRVPFLPVDASDELQGSHLGAFAIAGSLVCFLAYASCLVMIIRGLSKRNRVSRLAWLPLMLTIPWGGGGLIGATLLIFLVLVCNQKPPAISQNSLAENAAPPSVASPIWPWICAFAGLLLLAIICSALPWHLFMYSPLAMTIRHGAFFWTVTAIAVVLAAWQLLDSSTQNRRRLSWTLTLIVSCAIARPLLADVDPIPIQLRQPLTSIAPLLGRWARSSQDDSNPFAKMGFVIDRSYLDTRQAQAAGIQVNSAAMSLAASKLERQIPLSVIHFAAEYSSVPRPMNVEGFTFLGAKALGEGWKSIPIVVNGQTGQLRFAPSEGVVPSGAWWIWRIAIADGKLETDIDRLRDRLNGRWHRPRTWAQVELLVRGGSEKQAVELMTEFFTALMPELRKCLPNGTE